MVVAGFAKRKQEENDGRQNSARTDLLYRFIISEIDKPFHSSGLTSADEYIDLNVHTFGKIKAPLCSYWTYNKKECAHCQEEATWGGKNKPKKVRSGIHYFFESVNNKIVSRKDPKKTYDDRPVKVLETPFGQQNGNLVALDDTEIIPSIRELLSMGASAEEIKEKFEDYRSLVFRLMKETEWSDSLKKEVAVFRAPTPLDPVSYKKLSKNMVLQIPQEVKDEYDALTSGEKISRVLVAYSDVDYDWFNNLFDDFYNDSEIQLKDLKTGKAIVVTNLAKSTKKDEKPEEKTETQSSSTEPLAELDEYPDEDAEDEE